MSAFANAFSGMLQPRPLTDDEYAAAVAQMQQQQGAPANFGGAVLPNPNGVQPKWDTDLPEPTRLPNGVQFQSGPYTGGAKMDVSNPPAADIIPSMGRTIGAQTTGAPIPLPPGAKLESQPADTAIKLPPGAKLESVNEEHNGMPLADSAAGRLQQAYEGTLPLTDYDTATLSGVGSIARGVVGAGKSAWNTLKTAADAWNNPHADVGDTVLPDPHVEQVPGAVKDINASQDPTGAYLKAAGETAGQGAGAAITALATEGAARGIPDIVETVRNVPESKWTAPVRAAVKAANKVLQRAPGTVGGSAGAAAGGYLGGHLGAEIGGAAGAMIGRELLPSMRIPGEHIGLPSRIEGGPSTVPEVPQSAAGSIAESVKRSAATSAEAEQPEVAPSPQANATGARPISPAKVEQAAREALGVKEVQPGVPLKAQGVDPIAKPVVDALGSDAKLIGSRAKGTARMGSDIDLKMASPDAVGTSQAKLESMGYESRGSSVISPKDAKSFGKQIDPGWNRVHHFENPTTGQKVDLWASAEHETASAPELPDGFKPATNAKGETSSAMRGYKYDPASNELHVISQNGQHYVYGDMTPDRFGALEAAESKGKAWNVLKQDSPLVAKVLNGKRVAVKPTVSGESSPTEPFAPQKKPPQPDYNNPEVLQKALEDSLSTLKKPVSGGSQGAVPPGGVMSTVDPEIMAGRWGVDEQSLIRTREQTRGWTPEQTRAELDKMTDLYKKGHPVEPIIETRDAANNITEVDGRGRLLAAQRAGVKRIPIIVRRSGVAIQ